MTVDPQPTGGPPQPDGGDQTAEQANPRSRQRSRTRSTGDQPARAEPRSGRRRAPKGTRQTGAGTGGKGKQGGGGGRRRSRNAQRSRGRKQRSGVGFWGDRSRLPSVQLEVRIADQPATVPESLGPPPLPGHEAIAQHYFGVVYDRAVTTAGALAAAGGLIEPDELTDDDDE